MNYEPPEEKSSSILQTLFKGAENKCTLCGSGKATKVNRQFASFVFFCKQFIDSIKDLQKEFSLYKNEEVMLQLYMRNVHAENVIKHSSIPINHK